MGKTITITDKRETACELFSALAKEARFNLFRYIASSGGWYPTDLISQLGLTVKRFYSAMNILREAGLVKRHKRKYYLTSYGKIINESINKMVQAQQYSWILTFIDEGNLTPAQKQDASLALIKDESIRNLAMSP